MSLDPERWLALSPFLDQALDLAPEARREFVARLGIERPELAVELAALLENAVAAEREGFLNQPVAPIASPESTCV